MSSTILAKAKGGHDYGTENSSTNDCLFGCGAWMGGSRSGAPDGINPFGTCPNNTETNREEDEVKILEASSLIGMSLVSFTVQKFTQVYKTDVDGRGKEKIIGHFKNEAIATAFADNQTDSVLYWTEKVLLLTDGKVAYIIGKEANLMDDEKVKLQILQSARAKLSPAERELLGL